ncbi:hypothetical protein OQX61_15225 [Pedobacter sp. PLR]|uniref:RelA/SpoT domain-containing protein n=1 Tax=Pedobacter sp. PLR TaxID=2994465 RepID=UPI002248147E|nr:hypothetical protein [Pedobacter sp. PLR]MCX2452628.1 hypothetical protein [Pedobacter sp. PLR]
MSMIQQADFLRNHNLTSADFKATNLNYDDLLNISADFESKRAAYDEIGTGVVKILFKFNAVHAIRYEVRNPEELIYKLIAYKLENPEAILDLTNYETLIENLISIRIIPLFKSDWAKIHDSIVDQFVVIGTVTANVRAEDAEAITKEFTAKGCTVKTQANGYRSIDYVIKTAPSKKEYKVAVQIRSIFEEGWAEIDRSARDEHKTDNMILNDFSRTLDKLASSAAEMGEFIYGLQSYLTEKDILVQEQQALVEEQKTLVQEQQAQLADLRAQLAQANLEKKEKEVIPAGKEQLLSNGSDGMIGKSIIEDLAKTAAGIDGGSVPIETPVNKIKAPAVQSPEKKEKTVEVQIKAVEVKTESAEIKAEESPASSGEKPKTVKNRTDKPKVVKLKEAHPNEGKAKLEMAPPIVEDLFGQTRIPDAPPLKPSNTNA